MHLVDKAIEAETNGLWGRAYFDARGLTNSPFKLGDDWIRTAATVARRYGYETVLDDQPATLAYNFPLSQVALYAGWYDGNVSGPFTKEKVEFMPGAIAYHLHSFNATTIRTASEHWVGPLLAKGVTATMGSVNEPFLQGTPDLAVFFSRLLFNGFTFGEAAYACQAWLSWQNTIIGDPLYRPAVRNPEKLHEILTAQKSELIQWSYLRVVNLNLQTGLPPQECIQFLEQLPEARTSAVLQEKIGDLYTGLAKLNDSFQPYENALKLNPTIQQETRIALKVAPLLASFGRTAEAFEVYQKFLKDVPGYSDLLPIYEKVAAMANTLGKTGDAEKYQLEIARLRPPPAGTITNESVLVK
jgi:tetratricopeptide (TPR) repeat protein